MPAKKITKTTVKSTKKTAQMATRKKELTKTQTLLQALLFRWLPLGFAITMLCGIIYATVQQNYRQNANDPQTEIISGLVGPLAQGQSPEALNSTQRQDLANTLSPFVMVFDEKGKVVASTADLNGKVPTVPMGILSSAKKYGENRVTWQPAPNVREAVIVDYYKGKSSGYVLVGKSLTEVEKREDQLTQTVFVLWLVTLLGSFFISYLVETMIPPSRR